VIPFSGYRNPSGRTEQPIKQFADSLVDSVPLGGKRTFNETAKGASFLASDESSYVTGIELVIDGGMTQI